MLCIGCLHCSDAALVGFLYRYYNNARTDYQAEISRHEFPMTD